MRHLAALLYQALRHLFETEAASITDRLGPTENAEYGTAGFVKEAGANDEELSPPVPLTPAPEDQVPTGDDLAGGGGPVLGDPRASFDTGALPKDATCVHGFDLTDLASRRSYTKSPPPRRPWRTGPGPSAKWQLIWQAP